MRRFISGILHRIARWPDPSQPTLAELERIDRHVNAELRRTRLGI